LPLWKRQKFHSESEKRKEKSAIMSHFSVLIPAQDEQELEDVLAPYQQNNMGTCGQEFLEFYDTEDEYRQEYESGSCKMLKAPDGSLKHPCDEQFRNPAGPRARPQFITPEGYEEVEMPLVELYLTFDEYLKGYVGHDGPDPKTGRYGYWENPNARWDCWTVGGRYTSILRPDYDPRADPANYEQCWLCGGTGDRPGWVFYEDGERLFKDDWARECQGCNGCQGAGKMLKSAYDWKQVEWDSPLVRDVDFARLREGVEARARGRWATLRELVGDEFLQVGELFAPIWDAILEAGLAKD
jgi:hypothetical protein